MVTTQIVVSLVVIISPFKATKVCSDSKFSLKSLQLLSKLSSGWLWLQNRKPTIILVWVDCVLMSKELSSPCNSIYFQTIRCNRVRWGWNTKSKACQADITRLDLQVVLPESKMCRLRALHISRKNNSVWRKMFFSKHINKCKNICDSDVLCERGFVYSAVSVSNSQRVTPRRLKDILFESAYVCSVASTVTIAYSRVTGCHVSSVDDWDHRWHVWLVTRTHTCWMSVWCHSQAKPQITRVQHRKAVWWLTLVFVSFRHKFRVISGALIKVAWIIWVRKTDEQCFDSSSQGF